MLSPTCFEPRGFIIRERVIYTVWYVSHVSVWAVWWVGECVREPPIHFMESEGSLPHSQVPATCLHSEPDQSSPPPPSPTSHFLKIHLNSILPSKPGFSKWSPSLRLPHQNPIYSSTLPHMRFMPRPSHSSRSDHPNNIWWEIQIIKLLIMWFFSIPLLSRSS